MELMVTWTEPDGSQGSYRSYVRELVEKERQKAKRRGCTNIEMVELDFSGNVKRTIADTADAEAIFVVGGVIVLGFVTAVSPIAGLVCAGLLGVIAVGCKLFG